VIALAAPAAGLRPQALIQDGLFSVTALLQACSISAAAQAWFAGCLLLSRRQTVEIEGMAIPAAAHHAAGIPLVQAIFEAAATIAQTFSNLGEQHRQRRRIGWQIRTIEAG